MGGRNHLFGYIGTSFQARKWFSLDLCGFLGVSLSWGVHLFAITVIAWKLIAGSFFATALYLLVYLPTAIFAMASLFMAWTTNPGAVPLGARPLTTIRRASSMDSETTVPTRQRGIRRCHKCQDNFKPARAHHDSVTGRCIVKFDHFCPWVGNAVGAKNHKFFCLFLLYTAATCILSLIFLLLRAIRCGFIRDVDSNDNNADQKPSRMLAQEYVYAECNDFYGNHIVTALLVCSIVFLVFTCSMGCEQLEAIETGKSKIARMKMRVGQAGTEFDRVTDEFNELFGGVTPTVALHWFLPTPVQFPQGMEKVVMGYEWDEAFEPIPYQESNDGANDEVFQAMESGAASAAALPEMRPLEEDGEEDGVMLTSIHSQASASGSVKNRRSNSRDDPFRAKSTSSQDETVPLDRTGARLT